MPQCLLLLIEDDLFVFLFSALHGHLADGGESTTSEMERRGVKVHFETRRSAIRCMRIIGTPDAVLAAFRFLQRAVTQPALREWNFVIEAYVCNKRIQIEQRSNNMTVPHSYTSKSVLCRLLFLISSFLNLVDVLCKQFKLEHESNWTHEQRDRYN